MVVPIAECMLIRSIVYVYTYILYISTCSTSIRRLELNETILIQKMKKIFFGVPIRSTQHSEHYNNIIKLCVCTLLYNIIQYNYIYMSLWLRVEITRMLAVVTP